MTINTDIFTSLTNHAGLSALVSSRLYPIKLPQKPTYPLIKYQRVTNEHINSLTGSSGLNKSRYQFDIYSETHSAAGDIADQLALAMASGSYQSILLSTADLDFDDNAEKYRITIDYSVWHT